jgi:hypothetical protein
MSVTGDIGGVSRDKLDIARAPVDLARTADNTCNIVHEFAVYTGSPVYAFVNRINTKIMCMTKMCFLQLVAYLIFDGVQQPCIGRAANSKV